MITLPILGSLLEAAGTVIEKKILRGHKIDFRNYTVYEFFAITVMFLPFIYFVWHFDTRALQPWNLLIMAFVVVCATAANLLVFYSLKRKNVTEFEPIWIMQPLFTILLAFVFFSAERNWTIVGLALVASIALVLSHVKKHHLVFDRYIIAALLGSFLFAVELVASKPILSFYSPFSFYFVRCFFVLVITYVMFRPSFRTAKMKSWLLILAVGLMWVFYRAIIYYGYEQIGIVFTTLLFVLSPVFMFLFAVVFLKEKPTRAQIISTIIIVVCVGAAIWVNK